MFRNDVGRLEYLTMCVKESLRTHPPVPNVGRITTKPLTVTRFLPSLGSEPSKTQRISDFTRPVVG